MGMIMECVVAELRCSWSILLRAGIFLVIFWSQQVLAYSTDWKAFVESESAAAAVAFGAVTDPASANPGKPLKGVAIHDLGPYGPLGDANYSSKPSSPAKPWELGTIAIDVGAIKGAAGGIKSDIALELIVRLIVWHEQLHAAGDYNDKVPKQSGGIFEDYSSKTPTPANCAHLQSHYGGLLYLCEQIANLKAKIAEDPPAKAESDALADVCKFFASELAKYKEDAKTLMTACTQPVNLTVPFSAGGPPPAPSLTAPMLNAALGDISCGCSSDSGDGQ